MRSLCVGLIACLSLPSVAGANVDAADRPSALSVTTWRPEGLSFTIGGGVGDYFSGDLGDRSEGLASGYELRGAFGTRSVLAVELSHFGLVQRFDLDVVDGARMLVVGGELDVRANLPVHPAVRPFVAAGAGYSHANVLGRQGQRAGDDDRKNFFHVPVAAGVSFYTGGFVLEVRTQLRLTPDREARLFSDIDDARLHSWSSSAVLGFNFH